MNNRNQEIECDSCMINTTNYKNTDVQFYRCETCGQIMATVGEVTNPLSCCGQEMKHLQADVIDADKEKHVPVYHVSGHKVMVDIGKFPHPMIEDHYIEWICLVTCCGIQWKPLEPGDAPTVTFRIQKDEVVQNVYAYCNVHGLWKA